MNDPSKATSNVVWPGIPSWKTARTLAVQFQLNQSQFWPPERMLQVQQAQAAVLIEHAANTVPFYHDRLRAVFQDGRAKRVAEAWSEIPLLSRSEIQENFAEMQSRATPQDHGSTHHKFTGGATGQPVVVTGTEVTRFFWQATTLRDHFWHGRDFDQTLAVIRFFGERSDARDDKIAENWGSATSGWKKTGPCAMLDVFHTTDEQAEWLARVNPDYLLAYPSVVHALIRYCVKSGITFPNLKEVRTFGEVLEPNVRRLCQDAWGVKIVDAYSAAEVGYVALECPQSGCYHVQSEDVLLEVLDKHNAPCRPGEVGKVVVTSLHNFAMPLIRYDMGDFAEVGEACSCGRTLPALNRIIGRSRNMLALPDGRMRWPSVGSEVVDGVPGIRQAQAIQKDLDHIELNLVCEPRLNETQRNRLTQYVQEAFGHPFDISIVYRDRIERSPSGKYEDFRSEVPMPI